MCSQSVTIRSIKEEGEEDKNKKEEEGVETLICFMF